MAPDAITGDRKRDSARLEPFEVRPRIIRNMILGFLGSGGFVALGAWLLWYRPILGIIAGLPAIIFFGYIGLFLVPRLAHRRITMTLTPDGIVQQNPAGNSLIPWHDVEAIGIATHSSSPRIKFAGVRLRSHERYLKSMSPELVRQLQRPIGFLSTFTTWVPLFRFGESTGGLKDVKSLADALAFTRRLYGYDVVFAWQERDRSAKKFAALLEQYRAAATAK